MQDQQSALGQYKARAQSSQHNNHKNNNYNSVLANKLSGVAAADNVPKKHVYKIVHKGSLRAASSGGLKRD